jgi:hypothetical protein
MWDWYEWDSLEEFNTWHDAICVSLGYPLDSYNQATGEMDPNAKKTTAYTSPSFVDDKVIATVEEINANGLTVTLLRLPSEPAK